MAKIEVLSEIAGVVREICAQPGDALRAEDPVILVECMKMEIPVCSPRAGKLVAVLVAPGEPVSEGQAVASIET